MSPINIQQSFFDIFPFLQKGKRFYEKRFRADTSFKQKSRIRGLRSCLKISEKNLNLRKKSNNLHE